MKSILHFQIDSENMRRQGINLETVGKFVKVAQDKVGDEYYVIASPFIPSQMKLEDQNMVLYNFEMNTITLDELRNILKE